MAGRRTRDLKRSREWRRSWLLVLAACSGFGLASLQLSITVAEGHDGVLVSALGPDELPRDQAAALAWLADAGIVPRDVEVSAADEFGGDGGVTPSLFTDMVERALAKVNRRSQPGITPPVPPTETTTTTARPTTTTTQRPTTTTTQQSEMAQAEQRFVDLINQERTARGLPELDVNPEIQAVARGWTATMIGQADGCADLDHNPGFADQMPEGWKSAAENVGCGQSVETIHRALMNSNGHRDNILGRNFTDIGVGVGIDANNTMWVTQNFAQLR